MCDTLVAVRPGRTLFAKNSDRPVGEAQVVESFAPRPAGGRIRTQYLEIDDDGAHGVVGSRPHWLWGFEHGVNDHGVAIGNERVWTRDNPNRAPLGLIGMDLVRLGLERGATAEAAVEVMVGLLEQHGQGGPAEPPRDGLGVGEAYYSSFLVADPGAAWILETSGRNWSAGMVPTKAGFGGAAISNRISLPSFDEFRHPRAPTGHADVRLAVTRACVSEDAEGLTPRALLATMRDHGGPAVPEPETDPVTGAGVSVCMHIRDYQATAASMICELSANPRHPGRTWAALGSPCVSVYIPIGKAPPSALADPSTWQRFDRLRRRVEADPSSLTDIRAVLDPVQDAVWEETRPEHAWALVAATLRELP